LLARGGVGGLGNPHFPSAYGRSSRLASRGVQPPTKTLELELKLLADVGLVGLPNAGKSTLLIGLTGRKAEVAGYAFTTLNPQVGVVRVSHEGGIGEKLRFTIADNPGLIPLASQNVGLGHSFLRSIERSLALAFVLDISIPEPHKALQTLREELDSYSPGLSKKGVVVVLNKAD
ncbi:hypothetical protein TREMEDRAFT_23678, partial [Tremella mesenterica DSM 1558]|uniref:uncharacterized protein n=1 Tax=Tremella mesenterica (strain ATCC 24925 / CBS 8224 / DSM 1558 / NBRC 9311 / NRRL Y-6157 / RJB 2259-6 / UBC 559-6) TaxID=578456 RepID=UPI0003F49055